MLTVYVPDVGDGLAVGIRTICKKTIQIDCGSQTHYDLAFRKGLRCIDPEIFFLSHFHVDHYNGLFFPVHPYREPPITIHRVFFPRIPQFKQRTDFIRSMLSMNHRVMGDISGSMVADFLGLLSKLNFNEFVYRSLSKGDEININGTHYEVLWPPRTIDEESTLKVIKNALYDFQDAAEEDEILRHILERVGESGEMRPYTEEEGQVELPGYFDRNDYSRMDYRSPVDENSLPEKTRKANASLRKAANHMSLAFHEDNKFLFLGDLEKHEIKEVVGTLIDKERTKFFITVTPHHGTHWHDSLQGIQTFYAISSVGPRLFRYLSPKYKSISDTVLYTHLNGDIEIPVFFPEFCEWSRRLNWKTFS